MMVLNMKVKMMVLNIICISVIVEGGEGSEGSDGSDGSGYYMY